MRETSTRSARRKIPPSASIFAQITRRFYCRVHTGCSHPSEDQCPCWLDDATLRNARSRALEISHAEYSDTVLAYLDPAQREQLQDEDIWIARQLFVGDLIDQILAVPPETIT